ncbi:MAG TPA: iron-sulfur cluster biosynthesis protein [Pseudonocardiaceae bacterium]|jgi:Fe-S cluster assembly iron-binding protein IscA|nr:iron-sulfur cluster biosynthesis protein [Pseudonocardiaceae bacterium]
MLALTPAAVEVVTSLTAASGVPETGGLRIASTGESQTPQASTLELAVVEGPAQNDEVVGAHGARIFLEHEAAGFLADKVLDGQLDDQGRARFVVGDQEPDGLQPA